MLPARWRRLFRLRLNQHDLARDVDRELAFHLQMRAQRLVARGIDPAAAEARARSQFGNMPQIRDACLAIDQQQERDVRLADHLAGFRQDLAYTVRTLGRHRRFAIATLLVLAVGLGANIATFALIDALMLRSLPVPDAARLVTVGDPTQTGSVSQGNIDIEIASYPLYREMRDQLGSRVDLLASGVAGKLDVLTPGAQASADAEHPRGRLVSNNYFAVLGVGTQLGRPFLRDSNEVAGAEPVVVVSDGYWRRSLASDQAVIGKSLQINGTVYTIIGVTPRGFTGEIVGQSIDLWIPVAMQGSVMPHSEWLSNRRVGWLMMMGRLRPATTFDAARAEITAVERRIVADYDSAGGSQVSALHRAPEIAVGRGANGFSFYRRPQFTRPLFILMVAVGVLLVIVCANVANLLIARGVARSREIGIRMAIGAGRGRVVRQLLAESLFLAAAGSALGLVVAYWLGQVLLQLGNIGGAPLPITLRLNNRVAGFIALLVLATGLVFGLVPALHGTRIDVGDTLRGSGRGVSGHGRGQLQLGKVLVGSQIALSVVLLVGMGMLERSMAHLQHANLGFDRDHLLVVDVDAQRSGYDGAARSALLRNLLERAAQVPGVAAVTASTNGLFNGTEARTTLEVAGFSARTPEDSSVNLDRVGPEYFRTIGGRVLLGREFRATDAIGAPMVAVVNQSFARQFFPGSDALGKRVRTNGTDREIVGVVADVQDQGVREPHAARLYVAMLQNTELAGTVTLEIRATQSPAVLKDAVRKALLGANGSLQLVGMRPLDALVTDSLSEDLVATRLLSAFGILALVLAAVGLYGVMSYNTLRRTNEFGLRAALGATRGDVVWLVLREAVWLLVGGAVVGLAGSLVATRLLREQLFGVALIDPVSMALAIGAMATALLLATTLPARRAAQVGPLVALRAD